jgi:hypothetical protein
VSTDPWFLLPRGRVHHATSDDYMRPDLCDARLRHTDDGWFLEATDSYLLVRRPIEMLVPEGAAAPVEGAIPREALERAAKRGGGGLIVRPDEFELCDVTGSGIGIAFKRASSETKWPDFDKLLGATTGKRVAFHVSADLLKRVSDAMGASSDGVTVEIDPAKPLAQIAVSVCGRPEQGCALVMPIKERTAS